MEYTDIQALILFMQLLSLTIGSLSFSKNEFDTGWGRIWNFGDEPWHGINSYCETVAKILAMDSEYIVDVQGHAALQID